MYSTIKSCVCNYKIAAGIVACTTIVITVSLMTYSPTDPSWFYYSTQDAAIHNQLGIAGSYTATFLLYLLGTVVYLMIPMGIYLFWIIASRASWYDEWDRMVCFGVLMVCCAALQHYFKIDFLLLQYPGGIIGTLLCGWLLGAVDALIALSLLYVGVWSSLIIMTRLYLVVPLHQCKRIMAYALALMQRLLAPIVRVIRSLFAHMRRRVAGYGVYYYQRIKERVYTKSSGYFSYAATVVAKPQSQGDDGAENSQKIVCNFEYLPPSYMVESSDEDSTTDVSLEFDGNTEINSSDSFAAHTSGEDIEYAAEEETYEKFEQARQDFAPYEYPSAHLFNPPIITVHDQRSQEEVQARARILEEKLECFGIAGSVVAIKHGPVVTLFEYEPAINTKLSKIMALEDDLALALQAMSIRIIAPVPGTPYVGFEVANKDRKSVSFATLARSEKFTNFSGYLPLILGEDTVGRNVVVDLATMPHLLIAGSTGSGKSVALNTMLISLLYKCTPDQLQMILIDPKRLEFASYADMAHLLFPIITAPDKSIAALRWVVQTMEERYEQMAEFGVRNMFEYNKMCQTTDHEPLPFIVVVIDELADLMMTTGKEIEDLIVRIAQMARASGIHMIVATQRPSVDVITGLIKVNFPSRISFRVTSKVDSRTILDSSGSEKLLGKGDMLFLNSNAAVLQRVHGAYISDEEIERIAYHIRAQRKPSYIELEYPQQSDAHMLHEADDALYREIIAYLETVEEVSISLLQRRFRIGYNRSARIIDMLETNGHISPSEGSKTRKVLH